MSEKKRLSPQERARRERQWEEQEQLAERVTGMGQVNTSRLERELDRGIGELPPNVPPGWMGEKAPDMRVADDDGPHGLNAGIIQETTENTTLLLVAVLFFIFFPAAFYVLWRAKSVPQRHKVVASAVMVAGVVLVMLLVAL